MKSLGDLLLGGAYRRIVAMLKGAPRELAAPFRGRRDYRGRRGPQGGMNRRQRRAFAARVRG